MLLLYLLNLSNNITAKIQSQHVQLTSIFTMVLRGGTMTNLSVGMWDNWITFSPLCFAAKCIKMWIKYYTARKSNLFKW